MPHVVALHRYPVKSLRGQALERATIGPRGIEGDRRWLVTDEGGRFLTRRELPQMALIDARPEGDGLRLAHPDLGDLRVERPAETPETEVRVWRDAVAARPADPAAGAFLSAALGRPVRLMWQPEESIRPVDPDYATAADHVSFADGFPLLITGIASLAALNDRLDAPVEMARFRPNLVIDGIAAWGEDRWRRIRIGALMLRIVKPCSRCIMTTQDPLTGERAHGNDPLTTLRRMGRMAKGGIMFGQNAIPDGAGEIAVGDAVEVLEAGESNLG
jgi:uncharacterized protein YcbX